MGFYARNATYTELCPAHSHVLFLPNSYMPVCLHFQTNQKRSSIDEVHHTHYTMSTTKMYDMKSKKINNFHNNKEQHNEFQSIFRLINLHE